MFKPARISEKILEILDLIEHCADFEAIPVSMLIKSLGGCITTCAPPSEHKNLLLATISRHLTTVTDTTEFITCLDAWIVYFVKHLSVSIYINRLLSIYRVRQKCSVLKEQQSEAFIVSIERE